MSRNGSGIYSLNTAGQPVVAGTTITSTAFNLAMADIATALTQSICVDGQTTTTARVPFAQGASFGAAIIYGGVTLSNAVTGTGNMVLSASPVFTGTQTATGGVQGVTQLGLFGDATSGSAGLYINTNGSIQANHYGAGTATFDASGNVTSISDPSQKVIMGPYEDGLVAVIAAASPNFMGWHKWRPESGMETEGIYASFFARDDFPIAGAVTKNAQGLNSFSDRPVIMALINAVAQLAAQVKELQAK